MREFFAVSVASAILAFTAPADALIGSLPLPSTQPSAWSLGGQPCNLIEVPAATPIGTPTSCGGVRPGAVVRSDQGQCTFNFLFAGGDGNRYIGTAGHCIVEDGQERTWADGPVARDGAGNRIGTFAYAILDDPKDFALIRLDPGVAASPQMCHFGGPTGINSETPSQPLVLHHYGQGVGVSLLVPARSALALGMPHPDHVFAEGVVVPGDSGSGITDDDGRAVGVIVTVGIHSESIGTDGVDAGTVGVTRLAPQVARAEQLLRTSLTLQTAPAL